MNKNRWPRNIYKARELQDNLSKRVRIVSYNKTPRYVAAVDASFPEDNVLAVASLYKFPSLSHIEDAFSVQKVQFPYVPGLLSFREGPATVSAIKKLRIKPDVILFDGQGIAHPRGIGIASHIGVITGLTTIGCAKSRLIGEFREPGKTKGKSTCLYYKGMKVGMVLRTRSYVRPVFISPGHKIDIKSSVEIIMQCVSKYRIPDPLRRADQLSRAYKFHR
jgi:deoxyribonuclease V